MEIHEKTKLLTMILLCLLLPFAHAAAVERMTNMSLTGTWELLSVDSVGADGSRAALYGADPQGMLVFDPRGHYASQIMRAERPRFASGKKNEGTPEEYKAATQGVNAHFGDYEVDAAKRIVRFRIRHALFPNWEGTTQERRFTLVGDTLTYRVPVPTSGDGAYDEVAWRRVK